MSDPIKLGLWGPSSAGKTAYLAQLFLHIPQLEEVWSVLPTEDSNRFMDSVQPQIDRNRFPMATAVTTTITKVAYKFSNRKTGEEAELVVEDRAGEEFENLSGENRKMLNEVHGLMVLFDAEADSQTRRQMIQQTLSKLNVDAARGARRDERPVAVCLSKADRLIRTPADLAMAVEEPRQFVLDRIDNDLLRWVDRFCSNYELFPISSVGVRVRHGVVDPVVFCDERLTLRVGGEGKPINLIAPIAWLFERIAAVGNGARQET
jgi:hypothetical protein